MISCADVEDLLEEMVQRTVDDAGQVTVIRDAPFSIVVRAFGPHRVGTGERHGQAGPSPLAGGKPPP